MRDKNYIYLYIYAYNNLYYTYMQKSINEKGYEFEKEQGEVYWEGLEVGDGRKI